MKQLRLQLNQLLSDTRREWMREVLYNYRLTNKKLWYYYGYQSSNEMKEDLLQKESKQSLTVQ
ncbi:hypothetical protein F2P58_22775 [Vibrio fortis]|uniref:Uncharacterized protein n=1 Tax=Vibrio fortis TaxID=212667 RepID=A0A5N3QT60_9VIBR|nr:hypothetical protein [Vibrio fortis]KAB0285348.1 hypothetical protein F2P58_22775 [Vibrio fortis]